ncbi:MULTISPECIES: hypothetical protein, partial [Comamonas]|uniref:hypothetical protein n=1 Tax=Comamonas TaxID=283 RepID=UPI00237D7E30
KWKMKAPDLFVKNVRNHPGPDIYAHVTCWSLYFSRVRRPAHCKTRNVCVFDLKASVSIVD